MNKIKVLVIDDSAVMRELLTEIINSHDDLEVVATAVDAAFALNKIRRFKPDVLTLDVEMPELNGLDFLADLMDEKPIPTLMVSALTPQGSETALRALELGAVDVIAKPSLRDQTQVERYSEEIASKIRIASGANLAKYLSKRSQEKPTPLVTKTLNQYQIKIIAIGASTGGTEATKMILPHLPANCPPVAIVQHMPEGFTKFYAERLNLICKLKVQEAAHDQQMLPGNVYVAPGGQHLRVVKKGSHYFCSLNTNVPVNYTRPSVDVLLDSVAKVIGKDGIGVLLTGMGKDGALGLKHMRDKGAITLAQSEASCVIYGMPKEAKALDAVTEMVDIDAMAAAILKRLGLS